jgi:predicted dehydrogenase
VAQAWAAKTTKPSVPARSAVRVLGANDRINVGMVGVGGMGTGHLRSFVKQSENDKDIQVTAVCDVYTRNKDRARNLAKLAEKDVHNDYRDVLARNDVDAVLIATPDHWHAQMAVDALAAGKDVYLQKPMTITIEEAADIVAATNKYRRILQVGSQHLSDPRFHKARELIQAGEIGDLLWAHATYSRNSVYGEWNYYVDEEASAQSIDWGRWLGPARKRPFSAERYFRWRKYWEYSGGIATDLDYHRLGPFLLAMGPQFPTRVSACGGIYVQKDREVPDTYATLIEYPGFYINISGSMANSAAVKYFPEVIYGQKGTIVFEKQGVTVFPELTWFRNQTKEPKTYETAAVTDLHRLHTDNFFSCMRSRKQPVLNHELGFQIMVAIALGVDSYRDGQTKLFDAGARKQTKRAGARPGFEGDGKNHPEGPKKRE